MDYVKQQAEEFEAQLKEGEVSMGVSPCSACLTAASSTIAVLQGTVLSGL